MKKSRKNTSAPELSGDLEEAHILEMMGPVPEKAPSTSEQSAAKKTVEIKVSHDSVYPEPAKDPREASSDDAALADAVMTGGAASMQSAVEAANEALKSMDPGLGKARIEKVDDDNIAMPNLTSANEEPVEDEEPMLKASDRMLEADKPLDSEGEEDYIEKIAADVAAEEAAAKEAASDDEEAKNAEPEEEEPKEASAAADPETEDALTDRAVDEIVASEGDAVLAAEDAKKSDEEDPITPLKKPGKKPNLLKRLWGNRAGRWIFIGGTLAILLALAFVPYTRYFALNTAGVRSSLSLQVLDDDTQQPLKNVQVSAAGVSGQTDSEGNITLSQVHLGKTKLLIEKRAFAKVSRDVTLGWGSNPLGSFSVKAVGTQYTFVATDFLSGKPITNAEVNSGDGDAHADKDGKIILTLDTSAMGDGDQITVKVSADKYRSETINLTVNNKETQGVKMVPARKHVFISKRSGKYDVYTVDVDGKNEKKIVSGTGLERDDISLIPHQNDSIAALVATRENVRDSSGYLLTTLYLLDTSSGDLVKIDQSEQVQVVGWSNDEHLIYVKVAAGSSGANPKRHRLVSFNAKNVSDIKELASSNSFNDVLMMGDKVYYAPSNTFQDNPDASLNVVNPDGSNLKNLLSKEVYNIFRTSYDTMVLSASDSQWYSYKEGAIVATVTQAPSSQVNRLYTDNVNNSHSLWVDTRDGKGVLLDYDITKKADASLATQSGIKEPVYWLSPNYVIFRVNDGRETADYVMNTDGGEAHKITDVTDTSGIDRWFYY